MLRGEFAGFLAPGFHHPRLSDADAPATTPRLSRLYFLSINASTHGRKASRRPPGPRTLDDLEGLAGQQPDVVGRRSGLGTAGRKDGSGGQVFPAYP